MNTNKTKHNRNQPRTQAVVETAEPKSKTIKLGIDVHLDRYVVVRILDGGTPQPPQRFEPAQFLLWAAKQLTLAEKVYTCYEAGPFGYSLHRQLEKMGATNYVVRPRDWDEYGKKVKTDKRDAKELALHLDRYVNGNHESFSVVRVPTPEQEQERSLSRQRESFQRERQRLAAQGRSHALYYGQHLQGEWWREEAWKSSAPQLPPIVVELLEPLRRLIAALEEELKSRTRQVEAAAPEQLPVGLGKLTSEILEREVADWNRFKNRRQVGSYTGLCPSEDSSSKRRFQGSINKHGNRRLRPVLVECMWRLCVFQPDYRGVKKWRAELLNPKTSRPRRKKIIVAMAREFAVDWWRVRTGRCQAEALGLKLQAPSPSPKAKAPRATERQSP
ncbi:MAG TPA: IS110 family transposase [Clostridia bacterium]|nr:IS110 family transposase [Clostridia bacterium]